MIQKIEDKLVANGWQLANPLEPHVWTKNNAVFDTLNDFVSAVTGVRVNFKNHGEGVNARVSCAERLALSGSF